VLIFFLIPETFSAFRRTTGGDCISNNRILAAPVFNCSLKRGGVGSALWRERVATQEGNRVTGVQCYDLENILAENFGEKNGGSATKVLLFCAKKK
jgi:hypothetical protein